MPLLKSLGTWFYFWALNSFPLIYILLFHQYHTILITVALQYILQWRSMSLLLCSSKIVLAILDHLQLQKLGYLFEVFALLQAFTAVNSLLICFSYIPFVLVCCVFIFICFSIFSFSFDIFFDTLVIQECLRFNFYIFVSFPVCFLLLIYNFILPWSEDILCSISVFKFFEVDFMTRHKVCPGDFHVHLRIYILLMLGGVFYSKYKFCSVLQKSVRSS